MYQSAWTYLGRRGTGYAGCKAIALSEVDVLSTRPSGIGETILIKAIASATGRAVPKIKADLAVHGDLGKVAQASRSTQQIMFQPKPLTVQSVFKTLKEIAAFSGHSVGHGCTSDVTVCFIFNV